MALCGFFFHLIENKQLNDSSLFVNCQGIKRFHDVRTDTEGTLAGIKVCQT